MATGNPWEREHAEIVREIVRRGHTVGNHTETHRQLPLLRNAEIEAELALSERKIERAIGSKPRLIRPPGGALSERVEQLLGENGYTSVMWALYGGDLEVETPEEVVRTFFRVLERREREPGDRGGIVLMHDTKRTASMPCRVWWAPCRSATAGCSRTAKNSTTSSTTSATSFPGTSRTRRSRSAKKSCGSARKRACNTVALR